MSHAVLTSFVVSGRLLKLTSHHPWQEPYLRTPFPFREEGLGSRILLRIIIKILRKLNFYCWLKGRIIIRLTLQRNSLRISWYHFYELTTGLYRQTLNFTIPLYPCFISLSRGTFGKNKRIKVVGMITPLWIWFPYFCPWQDLVPSINFSLFRVMSKVEATILEKTNTKEIQTLARKQHCTEET